MAPRVITDPDHPDFPHGTPPGKRRGCHCGPCLKANLRAEKVRRTNLARGIGGYASPEMVAAAYAKITGALAADPGLTRKKLANDLGVDFRTLTSLLTSGSNYPLTRRVAERIMRSPAGQGGHYVDARKYELMAGQMAALGWPMSWQSAQTGSHVGSICSRARTGAQQTVRAEVYAKLASLYERIDGAEATPEAVGGPRPRQDIHQAQAVARRNGHYPPACYDEDGNLDYAAIPGHPVAVANDAADEALTRALTYLKALDMFGGTTERAADYLATTKSTRGRSTQVASITKALDRFVKHHTIRVSDPGSVARRRHMAQVITDYSHGGVGSPVAVALALGMQDWTMNNARTVAMLTPDPKGKGRSSNGVTRPTEPHPGLAEADELAHLHPLVAVPMPDTDEVAA